MKLFTLYVVSCMYNYINYNLSSVNASTNKNSCCIILTEKGYTCIKYEKFHVKLHDQSLDYKFSLIWVDVHIE